MSSPSSKRRIGMALGAAAFLLALLVPSPFEGLPEPAWKAIGLATLMAVWWVSECLPLAATALAPLAVSPWLSDAGVGEISAAYAHPLIFLFLGGFLLSLAMERSQLHRRIALKTMILVGASPRSQVGGAMLVSAFLSMWISNTATAVMMTPIALSLIDLGRDRGKTPGLDTAMLLGVAYGASIGGMATLIGTPPNALLAAYLSDNYGIAIGFSHWMLFGVPFSAALLAIAWYWLTRSLPKHPVGSASREYLREAYAAMGPLSAYQRRVAFVFGSAALAWILRGLIVRVSGLEISDTTIAMIAALALFVVPNGEAERQPLLVWKATERLPWGILLLFGGGLALAKIIQSSGLSDSIGRAFQASGAQGSLLTVAVVVAAIVFLTEITSNTATAAGFLPLLGPIGVAIGAGPAFLTIPAALAASCAFMMPVATPPNAIVFASGELRVAQMMRAGLALNLVSIVLIVLLAPALAPLALKF